MAQSTGLVVLVTGANKGIGFETARQIGLEGHTVLIGSRDAGRGDEAAGRLGSEGIDARPIALDVRDATSRDSVAEQIRSTFGHLDVLVNNAGTGVAGDGPPGAADLAQVRDLFEVNFFSTLEVIQTMLPLLRKAPAGRIVNVSSGLGSLSRHSDSDWEFDAVRLTGYNCSKAALNMATILLAKELAGTGIVVNSVAPGFTATDLNGGGPGAQSPRDGARASVAAALRGDGTTGRFLAHDGIEPW
ncbi:SDR family NAD(P)-dependent oxidoreductase [Paroceanicella profunda]|uniref:SDR family NAD(P)-dependent oxidoreductase n=1 Tax=Paroceanicella profunda TaxID=2579971 RepID=A0A5B8G201_9RHOB|nr:SDR family NAD(P)-dependent oxidoreductase [Paroceanicella profunda]QDL93122.1 SDR family NAD(P)-dependent oxidoreductase [Paroceanicella profunda]